VCLNPPQVIFKYKIKTLLLKRILATGQIQGRYKYSLIIYHDHQVATEYNVIKSLLALILIKDNKKTGTGIEPKKICSATKTFKILRAGTETFL